MKKNKKLFIIGVVILLGLLLIGRFVLFNDDNSNAVNNNSKDKLTAPAESTKELKSKMKEVLVSNVTEDEIVFSNTVELKENQKVAVWIYSKLKFLGYFEILIENGIKKIMGLKEALEKINIDSGNHNIALTTESGESIGYINVNIKQDGVLTSSEVKEEKQDITTTTNSTIFTTTTKTTKQDIEKTTKNTKTITKEVKENIEINYETIKQNEVNMLKGTTSLVQDGIKGVKSVIYVVTYDASGNEISRQVKSEKITKQPVNKIEKVGLSDFNMNKDMLTETSSGPMCTQLNSDGYCDDSGLKYDAIKINQTYYIASITRNGTNIFKGLIKVSGTSGVNLVANYNGTKYYFYMSLGGGHYELLNEQTCNTYGLKCGRW